MADARSSDLAHRGVSICNPISPETLDLVVERTELSAGDSVVDIGCGKGELLLRLAARYGLSGVGVDFSQARVAEANAEARRRNLGKRVRFQVRDAAHFTPTQAGTSLAACVGATHALGGLDSAVRNLRSWIRADGQVLIGEGFWVREPDPEYLEAIGAARNELGPKGWIEERARSFGLEPVEQWTSTVREWDDYENALLAGIERYVRENPNDLAGPAMLADQRAFHAAQVRWGRSTMGFEVCLLRCP